MVSTKELKNIAKEKKLKNYQPLKRGFISNIENTNIQDKEILSKYCKR